MKKQKYIPYVDDCLPCFTLEKPKKKKAKRKPKALEEPEEQKILADKNEAVFLVS